MYKTAKCLHCGNEDYTRNMTKIDSPSRNYFYICFYCKDKEYGYSLENPEVTHKQAKHGLTYSIELETSDRNMESNWLYQYNFLPTSDGSITGPEWKSPIWRNLSGIKQLLRTIEKKCITDNNCGTHLNIGTYNQEKINMIKKYYHALFVPLSDYLLNHETDMKRIFGRCFVYYACPINSDSYPLEHRNFINIEHDTHLEFRLCKLITADQYMTCIKMCSEFIKTINNNFIAHYNDHEIDNSIEINSYRLHKANITAKKLIRIFKKYAAANV